MAEHGRRDGSVLLNLFLRADPLQRASTNLKDVEFVGQLPLLISPSVIVNAFKLDLTRWDLLSLLICIIEFEHISLLRS